MAPGAGPRHVVFHPTISMLYVVNELNSSVPRRNTMSRWLTSSKFTEKANQVVCRFILFTLTVSCIYSCHRDRSPQKALEGGVSKREEEKCDETTNLICWGPFPWDLTFVLRSLPSSSMCRCCVPVLTIFLYGNLCTQTALCPQRRQVRLFYFALSDSKVS